MKTIRLLLPPPVLRVFIALAALCLAAPAGRAFPVITNVVEIGGDNEATDTVPAKWTGVTYVGGVANEPVPGQGAATPYTVGLFGNYAPTFVDRNHRYTNASGTVLIPPYLVGQEYIMIGNDNRDNNGGTNGGPLSLFRLDISVATAVRAYLLVDNRLNDGSGANPPTFGPTNMAWVAEDGWAAVMTGVNRAGNAAQPDELGIDEGADNTINQYYSVYAKAFPAGTFTVKQPDNPGRNMYGVVVVSISPPNAPGNLVAVNGDGKVTLSWSASGGATGYIVKRALLAGGPYDNIATNASPGYVDTAVVNGVTYYYVVTAFSPAGESANSNEVIGTPGPAPSGVVAVGGTNSAHVSWNALVGAASYTVKRSTTSGGPYTTVASGLTETNQVDTGLQTGRFHYYVVVAQLLLGGEGGQSDEAAALTAPGAPSNVAASLWAASVIRLTWATTDAVPGTFYIEESLDGMTFSPLDNTAARSYLSPGLNTGTMYHYRVRAVNATGPSDYSTPISFSTPTFGLNVNFGAGANNSAGNAVSPIPQGFLNDIGDLYGDRTNGHFYGWATVGGTNITRDARYRQSANSPDLRYDTFNHLQKSSPPTWEIEIPNGFYQVHIASGDPDNFDSVFQFNIEGVITRTKFPSTGTRFHEYTNTVIVDDGRLTIANGPLPQNNKISFVDIYAATAANPPVIGTHPQPVTVEERHAATFSVTLSGGTEPFRYQWLHDNVAIPGATGPTLTLPDVMMADAGAYKVAISNYAGAVTSDAAMLTVVADTNPPTVLAVASFDGTTITICFSEPVDESQAEDPFNYVIATGVDFAVLQPDGRTVILTLLSPVSDTFTIQVDAVADRAGVSIGSVVRSGRVLGFTGEDINAPAQAGSHYTCDGSTFVITGGGNALGGTADQFHFVYCAVQGDFEVRTRVTDLTIANVFARAMLMVRETTAAGSRHSTLSVTAPQPGSDTGEPLARGGTGGATTSWGANFSPAGIPVWLRITRAGNTLTGFRSPDGANWTQVSQATIVLPVTLLVGLGVNAQDTTTLATATFTNFRIDWLTPAPIITNPVYNGGNFSGAFQSLAGFNYNIQYKDDLASQSWTLLTTLGGNGSTTTFTDVGPASSTGLRVYRITFR